MISSKAYPTFLVTFLFSIVVSAQNEKGAYTQLTTGETGVCKRSYDHEVLSIAEVQPQPVCGYDQWFDWVNANNPYFKKDISRMNKGNVYVEFVVDEHGKIIDPCILKKGGEPYDSEATRLVMECPISWTPGTQYGRLVKVKISIPVPFYY